MKVRLIAIIVAVLVVYGQFVETGSLANPEPPLARSRYTVSKWGTLLELFKPDGAIHLKTSSEGFKLSYSTRGIDQTASAIGEIPTRLETPPAEPTLLRNSTRTIVQTIDKVLEITSEFSFDNSDRELIIRRTFRNLSKFPVTLQMVENYLDPKLGPDPILRSGVRPLGPIRSSFGSGSYDCVYQLKCTPPICPMPPCPENPPYLVARSESSAKNIILKWPNQTTLEGKQPRKPGGQAYITVRIAIRWNSGTETRLGV